MFHYATAFEEAQRVITTIDPSCEVKLIAGSIRRHANLVHDIEVVCIPKKVQVPGGDLFAEPIWQRDPAFIAAIKGLGKIEMGDLSQGRYVKVKLAPLDIQLDLFLPVERDFYRQFAIRTGNAKWVQKHVANGWARQGWVGCGNDGLRRRSDCLEGKDPKTGKTWWKLINKNGEVPPTWSSEADFFDWIKVKMIAPNLRNI